MSDHDDTPLLINDQGITRHGKGGMERVEWDKLVEVSILTTDAGPRQRDVHFVLASEDGSRFLVPSDLPESQQVLQRLQRLPGFDNEKVIEAMGSGANARFVCWKKSN